MPFKIIRNDITKMRVDAIVNTANPKPVIGSGTDTAVYKAAGVNELLAERKKIGVIQRGDARITPGFGLPARHIIHTVGPVWQGGDQGEEQLLRSCYENSLRLARENQCESIAFPLISTGNYAFPKDKAIQIVISVVSKFLLNDDMMIYLVVFDEKSTKLTEHLFDKIEAYVDQADVDSISEEEYRQEYFREYVRRHTREYMESYSRDYRESYSEEYPEASYQKNEISMPREAEREPRRSKGRIGSLGDKIFGGNRRKNEAEINNMPQAPSMSQAPSKPKVAKSARSLKDLMKEPNETFQQMLLRLISEKGMTNAQAYKKANQDKKLFSKIKNDVNYQPKKKTAMAFALALELNMDQTIDLLARAGYAFSPCSKFDKVIQYYIESKNYNIFEIEIALYDFELESLCNYA